jgi:hypothetical protein
MGTGSAVGVYRHLLLLYPRDFRDRYGDDLVQTFTDLTGELGSCRAWRRVTLDLVVTVLRYRMEALMKEERSSTVLTVAITVMACAGVLIPFIGLDFGGPLPWVLLGGVLLLLAAVLAITQRSRLARSMDAVDGTRLRRKRLSIATVLAVLLAVIYAVAPLILGDHWGIDAIVAFGLWCAVLIAAVGYFIAGIATPKSRVIS